MMLQPLSPKKTMIDGGQAEARCHSVAVEPRWNDLEQDPG
jgi:hypothetical protein